MIIYNSKEKTQTFGCPGPGVQNHVVVVAQAAGIEGSVRVHNVYLHSEVPEAIL